MYVQYFYYLFEYYCILITNDKFLFIYNMFTIYILCVYVYYIYFLEEYRKNHIIVEKGTNFVTRELRC